MNPIHESASIAGNAPARSTSTPLLLCIDDDPLVSETLQDYLEAYDVRLLSAYYGMQGIWMAAVHKPDLIITDLRMPMGTGGTVIECLKNNPKTAAIPIIVLTAIHGYDLQQHLEKIGADRFLNKPIHFQDLLNVLQLYIEVRKKQPPLPLALMENPLLGKTVNET
jgi:CheY-like chemotaxis protein